MRTFRALVVDDDDDLLELAMESADPAVGIHVSTASSLDQADKLIAEHFFNVAFVDIQLEAGAKTNVDGLTILRLLADVRPTCRRLLLTQYPDEYRAEIFDMLDPDDRLIDGAVDKDDFDVLFLDYVEAQAAQWLEAPVDVQSLEPLYERLRTRAVGTALTPAKRPIASSREELDYVISKLFGQGLQRTAGDESGPASERGHVHDDDISEIALDLLEGGKSRSVVASGRPVCRTGDQGIQCVVKVGPRDDTIAELTRYDRYVRFRLSLHRRVEMLGHALGDCMGAICYSFAGSSPAGVVSLQSLLDAEDDRAHDTLRQLLGDTADWQPRGAQTRDLGRFFKRRYRLDAREVVREVDAFTRRRARAFGARKSGQALLFADSRVNLPTHSDLGAGCMRGLYQHSVVHGDLNASNVILSDTDEIVLIDFRHTTRGPVTLDAAALEASVRLSPAVWADLPGQVTRHLEFERRLWQHDFTASTDWWPGTRTPPYWARISATLMEMATGPMQATRRQHAATCLLYALRVFRVQSIDPAARMRLLVWISAIKETLAAPDPA